MARLNVQNYGAAGDGSTDDTAAIQSAIDDATAGDTVLFPATDEYYAVSGGESILQIGSTDNLTLEGEGPDTEVRYVGGNGGRNLYVFRIDGGPTGFELRNMTINGGAENVAGDPNATLCILVINGDPGNQSYLFEDLLVENSYGEGFTFRTHDVTVRRCTARENGKHGMNFGPHDSGGEPLRIEQCLIKDNSVIHPGHYGIDHATGSFVVEDTVIEGNHQGCKTAGGSVDGVHRRTRIKNNGGHSYQSTNGKSGTLTFEDVVFGPNNGANVRLSGINYHVPDGAEVVVTGNTDTSGRAAMQVQAGGSLDASGGTVWSNNNDYAGLGSITNTPGNVVGVYNHADNTGGPLGNTDNLSVDTRQEDTKTDIEGVPTADEVGAWSDSDTSDDSVTSIKTESGSLQSTSGTGSGSLRTVSRELQSRLNGDSD